MKHPACTGCAEHYVRRADARQLGQEPRSTLLLVARSDRIYQCEAQVMRKYSADKFP
jgi:hypothetical protein